ncbi:unnamed protein product [Sphagnum balticum]
MEAGTSGSQTVINTKASLCKVGSMEKALMSGPTDRCTKETSSTAANTARGAGPPEKKGRGNLILVNTKTTKTAGSASTAGPSVRTMKGSSRTTRGFYLIRYRDVKPENILIHDGDFKIADFGFAKNIGSIGQLNKSLVWHAKYMAPQLLRIEKYSTKCDIWAIGLIFYEMLFGECHDLPVANSSF